MGEQEQFIDVPPAKGFNVSRLALIVSVILTIGGGLMIIAIFQKPGGGDSTPPPANSIAKIEDPNHVQNSDDEINRLITISEQPNLAIEPNMNKIANAESVPPITSSEAKANAEAANVSDIQQQIMQAKNQAQIKRVQVAFAAYASKSLINIKSNASGAMNNIPPSVVQNKESPVAGGQSSDNPYSSATIISAKSPYELKAGALIPCVMISGLNSEISGTVKSQVTENVYDSINGRSILIPQGSVLIGKYSNELLYGEDRIGVGWNQLLLPNGDYIDLKGLPGSDLAGFNGFSDIVDNHYWQLFGTSFIMGVITGAMQYSQNNTNANVQTGGIGVTTNPNPTVGQTMSGSLGQQLGQTGMAVTNKALNIAPTIIIRQGMQFNVMLTATLILRPYKG
ncbi:MAG: transcriptional regulator [Burkholderiales bacterium]|jgi:type IV secretory pathway VirB10-like protein|nr:transcriptional regulator [Burkholderiales bacterium]